MTGSPPADAPAILLTGASGSLGREIAKQLRTTGARLTLTARSRGSLTRLYPENESDLLLLTADLTEAASAAALISGHMRRFGRLDSVIHAAGRSAHVPLRAQSDEEILDLVSINLLAPIRLTRAALDPLQLTASRVGFASNVCIGSIAAVVHPAEQAVYAAAKSGLVGFSLAVCKEMAPTGVKCVVVSPGSLRPADRKGTRPPEHLLDPGRVAEIVAAFALGQRSLDLHVVIHAPAWDSAPGAQDSR